MILAAAGDVDHDRIVRLAERDFGDMAPMGEAVTEPARFAGGEHRVEKDLEQAHFALALAAPGYRDEANHAAQIAAVALGGGMSSRLFQEARERRGLCYTISAQCAFWTDTGLLTVYAGTGAEEIAGLVDLTADEIARAARDLTEAEVTRARAQTRAGLLMGLEGPSARAERLASQVSVFGRAVPVAETLARLDAVGVAEAREAAAGFAGSAPALALYGPVSAARDVSSLADRLAA
jgi:predicted Zn-dependent peptidase